MKCSGEEKRGSSDKGFVLPMTLVVIAILGLALWAAMSVLDGMRRDLEALNQGVRLETAAQRAEGRVLYLALSEPTGQAGLRINGRRVSRAEDMGIITPEPATTGQMEEEDEQRESWLRFDGQPYELPPAPGSDLAVTVSIQDDAGLFNINTTDERAIALYMAAFGQDDLEARSLAGALADFVDKDDLKRLNGAEEAEYARAGQQPPSNRDMRETAEIWQVLGWKAALTADLRRRVMETTTAALMFSLSNVNTASPEALMAWFGLTREEADDVVEERRRRPLLGVPDITQITGVNPPVDDFRLYAFPSRRFRLRVSAEGATGLPQVWETWLTRAEFSADRPYYRGRSSLIDLGRRPQGERNRDGELEKLPESRRLLAR